MVMKSRKPYKRADRVASLIMRELAPLLQQVTLLEVKVSKDIGHATVFVSMLSKDKKEIEAVVADLNNHAKKFQYQLAQRVDLRYTPELYFKYDDSIEQANRVEALLAKL
jgi:ribosome-binding factor A